MVTPNDTPYSSTPMEDLPTWNPELIDNSTQSEYGDNMFAWINGLQMEDLGDVDLEGIHHSEFLNGGNTGDLGIGFDEIMTDVLERAPVDQQYAGKEGLYNYEQPATTQWQTEDGNGNLLPQYPVASNNIFAFPLSTKSEEMSVEDPLLEGIPLTLDFENLASPSNEVLTVDKCKAPVFKAPSYLQEVGGHQVSNTLGETDHRGSYFVPPVTVSECSRPCSPHPKHRFVSRPPSGTLRKRHHSESAASKSPNLTFGLTSNSNAIPRSISPAATASQEPVPRLIRRASSRLKRHSEKNRRHCEYCPDPSVYNPNQKRKLEKLPLELLIEIFTFACSSLPTKRAWICDHQMVGNAHSSLPRRSTLNGAFPDCQQTGENLPDDKLVDFYQKKFNLPRHLRLLHAKTILALQLTCRQFRNIFTEYPEVDNKLWKEATLCCWGHLPKTLEKVQGKHKTSQTCWRNVFGVFMRGDNGLFRRRPASGVGGVESFGGKSGFKGAILWKEEKMLRMTTSLKGKERSADSEQQGRKLVIVCPQPGPDMLTVKPLHEGDGYIIGLGLRGGETVFVRLDEHGNFSQSTATLPPGLGRGREGRFPPDCFEGTGDRLKVVRVEMGTTQDLTNAIFTDHTRRTTTWDLHCIPEFADDKRASVARCQHINEYLVFNMYASFNMFASREGFIEGLDRPQEDNRVFCVAVEDQNRHGESMSHYSAQTALRWCRTFQHPRADDYPESLHYNICSLKLNSTRAVVLIRWNKHSRVSYHEFVDRSFQVLDLASGDTVKVLQFPNFHWDFRHHDMTPEYNVMRYYKMRRIYNARDAENRATRIHEDEFTLDESGRLVSGSHDYCNWMWQLNEEYDAKLQSKRIFNPFQNDAGNGDPFTVLDDFYWKSENTTDGERTVGAWDTNNERAGWWVKTPNQVLCFWHNITTSKGGRWFAAVRAGRMFVWDLENPTKVQGFSCALGTYTDSTRTTNLGRESPPSSTQLPTVDTRYLGQLRSKKVQKKLTSWHVWNGIIPDQGLWLLYEDGKAVYLDRDDILDACGLSQQGKQWEFSREDFGNLYVDDNSAIGDRFNNENEEGDGDDDYDSADSEFGTNWSDMHGGENAIEFVDEGVHAMTSRARRKRRRTSTMTSHSVVSSFVENETGLMMDNTMDQFMFDNELPDAESWEKMDEEGWLKRVNEDPEAKVNDDPEAGLGPMEGSSTG